MCKKKIKKKTDSYLKSYFHFKSKDRFIIETKKILNLKKIKN